nr:hypothetical protein [uncultured Campylobacter sp.]
MAQTFATCILIFAFGCADFMRDFSENLDFKLKRRSFTDKKINLSNLSSFYNLPK